MVRSTMRRAAALAGTTALAVLTAAGPALASAGAPAPQTQAAVAASAPAPAPAAAPAEQAPQPQQGAAQDPASGQQSGKTYVLWCHHHHGLVSDLLEGVGDLLGALL